MKTAIRIAGLILVGLILSGCGRKQGPAFVQNPEIRAQLKSFAAAKEGQAQSLAAAKGNSLPPKVEEFFTAIENADWQATTNDYAEIRQHWASDEAYRGSWHRTVVETYGAAQQFTLGNAKYATAYGNEIIQSIPPGSIYFGGTDPGCFIVTAMQQSQVEGEPFFSLTQNALADGSYLDYARAMYGDKIYIPTADDSQKCFDDYYKDVQERQAKGQLQPGEDVTVGPSGKLQVSGEVAVMQINGLLVKVIFEKNTNQDFYVEESFPLAWMYPYLEPHGLIFKLNHQPLTSLSDAAVQQDHDYWTQTVSPMIGDWLTDDTPVQDIATFAEKVYLKHDFSGFTGDPAFAENDYTEKMFSKERSSIAGLYAWRAEHTHVAQEKTQMKQAADFAFRQSWALCPYSPEAVFRYVQFLMSENRTMDALVVAETAAEFRSEPGMAQIDSLVYQLKQFSKTQ